MPLVGLYVSPYAIGMSHLVRVTTGAQPLSCQVILELIYLHTVNVGFDQ